MTQLEDHISSDAIVNRFGFYTAILTTVATVVTFGIALFTPPLAGPFCAADCFKYPYLDIASRFPRDYIWMYPAMLLTLIYVTLMVCLHYFAPREKKIFSQIGLSFALISATALLIDYFLQVSVIQPSLINGETDGIALLTQYNPHGIFIALEDLGYLMMSVSFLFMAFVFSKANRLENAVRWLFLAGFFLTIISLIIISIKFGIQREYIFEVAAITINWTVLMVAGILLSRVFKR